MHVLSKRQLQETQTKQIDNFYKQVLTRCEAWSGRKRMSGIFTDILEVRYVKNYVMMFQPSMDQSMCLHMFQDHGVGSNGEHTVRTPIKQWYYDKKDVVPREHVKEMFDWYWSHV